MNLCLHGCWSLIAEPRWERQPPFFQLALPRDNDLLSSQGKSPPTRGTSGVGQFFPLDPHLMSQFGCPGRTRFGQKPLHVSPGPAPSTSGPLPPTYSRKIRIFLLLEGDRGNLLMVTEQIHEFIHQNLELLLSQTWQRSEMRHSLLGTSCLNQGPLCNSALLKTCLPCMQQGHGGA